MGTNALDTNVIGKMTMNDDLLGDLDRWAPRGPSQTPIQDIAKVNSEQQRDAREELGMPVWTRPADERGRRS